MKKIFTLLTAVMLCSTLSLSARLSTKDFLAKKPVSADLVVGKAKKAPAKVNMLEMTPEEIHSAMQYDWDWVGENLYVFAFYGDYYRVTAEDESPLQDAAIDLMYAVYDCFDLIEIAYETALENGEYVSPITDEYVDYVVSLTYKVLELGNPGYLADLNKIMDLANELGELAEQYPEYADYILKSLDALEEALWDAEDAAIETMGEAVEQSYMETYEPIAPYVTPESVTEAIEGAKQTIREIHVAVPYANDIAMLQDLFADLFEMEDSEEFPAFAFLKEEELAQASQMLQELYQQIYDAGMTGMEIGVYNGPAAQIADAANFIKTLKSEFDAMYAAIDDAFIADYITLDDLYSYVEPYKEGEIDCSIEAHLTACDIADEIIAKMDEVSDAAILALQLTGVYESPLDEATIASLEAEIKAFLESTDGINGIIKDAAAETYYDLNGKVVANPTAGKVYIRVANGKASKVVK